MFIFLTTVALSAEIHPLLSDLPKNTKTPPVALYLNEISPLIVESLQEIGFRPSRTESGALVLQAGWLSGTIDREHIPLLGQSQYVQKVEPAQPFFPAPLPLSQTAEQIRAPQSWYSSSTGEGTKIAVQEFVGQGWDIFHPDFFRPDGGCFDFVDANDNQIFDIGEMIVGFEGESVLLSIDDAEYNLDQDWIYLDVNQNGTRDFGAEYGDAPAFSEPIFVSDDRNMNQLLDVGERLCLLNTSKFTVIHSDGQVFRRGENLHEYNPSLIDPGHGTGAASIAIGGWPLMRKNTGIAPGADLIAITDSDHLRAFQIAQEEQADVMFFEWNAWHDVQDGSTAIEESVSDMWSQGVIPVAPCGNLGGSDHMAQVSLSPSQTVNLPFTIDTSYTYSSWVVSLTWKGTPEELSLTLFSDAEEFFVEGSYHEAEFEDMFMQQWIQETDRGTTQVLLYATALENNIAPASYEIQMEAQVDMQVRATVTDYSAGWSKGVHWTEYLTEEGSALSPSTADSVIAVGAYGGVESSYTGVVDELRTYSGRGPRIDGARVVDITAPDDPMAPSRWYGEETGSYNRFGGTSGATPHVAGGLALMQGMFVDEDDVLLWFSEHAEKMDDEIQDPTGWGRFRIHDAAESVEIDWDGVVTEKRDKELMTLTVEDDRWSVGWDVGYDGFIDTEGNVLSDVPIRDDIVVWVSDGIHPPIRSRYTPQETVSCGGCATSSSFSVWLTLFGLVYARRTRGC